MNGKLIGKYNKNTKEIDKFVEEIDLDESKSIYTSNKTVVIDGIKGMSSIELNFENVEDDYELEINKELLFDEEGEENSNKLTFNTKAVEKVDVSELNINVSRDPITKELVKEYEVIKTRNRSRGKNYRKEVIENDEILPDIVELFNNVKINIDEDSVNAGIINDNTIKKIEIFGNNIEVFGDKKLSYVSSYKYYPMLIDVSPLYVFCIGISNNVWHLMYKKIEVDQELIDQEGGYWYYLGNPTVDYGFDNSYYLTTVSGIVVENTLLEDRKIKFYNQEDELVYESIFHEDISSSWFKVNDCELMFRETYDIELRNLNIYLTGDDVYTQDIKEVEVNGNGNYIIEPDSGCKYIGKVKLKVNNVKEIEKITLLGNEISVKNSMVYYNEDNTWNITVSSLQGEYSSDSVFIKVFYLKEINGVWKLVVERIEAKTIVPYYFGRQNEYQNGVFMFLYCNEEEYNELSDEDRIVNIYGNGNILYKSIQLPIFSEDRVEFELFNLSCNVKMEMNGYLVDSLIDNGKVSNIEVRFITDPELHNVTVYKDKEITSTVHESLENFGIVNIDVSDGSVYPIIHYPTHEGNTNDPNVWLERQPNLQDSFKLLRAWVVIASETTPEININYSKSNGGLYITSYRQNVDDLKLFIIVKLKDVNGKILFEKEIEDSVNANNNKHVELICGLVGNMKLNLIEYE